MIKNYSNYESGKDKKVFMWIPMPPPYAGPEIVSEALIKEFLKYQKPLFIFGNSNFRKNVLEKGKLNIKGLFPFFYSYLRFLAIIIFVKPDIVYHLIGISKISFFKDIVYIRTAQLFRKKLVLHLRGGNYKNFYLSSSIKQRRKIDRIWSEADAFIVESNNLISLVPDNLKHIKTFAIPNALDPGLFDTLKINRKEGKIRLVFLGYLSFTKGFYDLTKVYPKLKEKYNNIEFFFAGSYPRISPQLGNFLTGEAKEFYYKNIENINSEIIDFIKWGESNDARYLGVISNNEEKIELLKTSDIFVLPSYMEGFSVALLEAMFAGLPIIATKVGAAPDVIKDGFNGFLTEPGDILNMTKNLEILIRDKALREEMGKMNIDETRKKFCVDNITKKYVELFNSI